MFEEDDARGRPKRKSKRMKERKKRNQLLRLVRVQCHYCAANASRISARWQTQRNNIEKGMRHAAQKLQRISKDNRRFCFSMATSHTHTHTFICKLSVNLNTASQQNSKVNEQNYGKMVCAKEINVDQIALIHLNEWARCNTWAYAAGSIEHSAQRMQGVKEWKDEIIKKKKTMWFAKKDAGCIRTVCTECDILYFYFEILSLKHESKTKRVWRMTAVPLDALACSTTTALHEHSRQSTCTANIWNLHWIAMVAADWMITTTTKKTPPTNPKWEWSRRNFEITCFCIGRWEPVAVQHQIHSHPSRSADKSIWVVWI